MSSDSVTIKFDLEGDVRRKVTSDEVNFDRLSSLVVDLWSVEKLANRHLKYLDEDGDMITVAYDADVEEAKRVLGAESLRFSLVKIDGLEGPFTAEVAERVRQASLVAAASELRKEDVVVDVPAEEEEEEEEEGEKSPVAPSNIETAEFVTSALNTHFGATVPADVLSDQFQELENLIGKDQLDDLKVNLAGLFTGNKDEEVAVELNGLADQLQDAIGPLSQLFAQMGIEVAGANASVPRFSDDADVISVGSDGEEGEGEGEEEEEAPQPQVHAAICDECESTIVGIRYKCVQCADFDLCESCESHNTEESGSCHDESHVFYKIHTVEQYYGMRSNSRRPCGREMLRRMHRRGRQVPVQATPTPVTEEVPGSELRTPAPYACVYNSASRPERCFVRKNRMPAPKQEEAPKANNDQPEPFENFPEDVRNTLESVFGTAVPNLMTMFGLPVQGAAAPEPVVVESVDEEVGVPVEEEPQPPRKQEEEVAPKEVPVTVKYAQQIGELSDMGFADEETNVALLGLHKGDVTKVIEAYLSAQG